VLLHPVEEEVHQIAGGKSSPLVGCFLVLYLDEVISEQLAGLLGRHLPDVAKVGFAAGLGEPVNGLADLLLAEFWLPGHGRHPLQRGKRKGQGHSIHKQYKLQVEQRQAVTILGVFAPLVGALVFKTSGGFEQSSQWVRFPYTPDLPSTI
jgi:hypothetical protein